MSSFNWSVSFNVDVLLVPVRAFSYGCVYVFGLWCPRICGGDGGLMRYISDSAWWGGTLSFCRVSWY